MRRLERVTTIKVTQADLLDDRVARYIVAVIMAPWPDSEQTKQHAVAALDSLRAGKSEAHWVLAEGKRCGVIVFTIGPYSNREDEKNIKVLYVSGVMIPKDAPASAWHTLMDEGKKVAAERGCRYIIFDVAPDGPHTDGIISAAVAARAQARFILEV